MSALVAGPQVFHCTIVPKGTKWPPLNRWPTFKEKLIAVDENDAACKYVLRLLSRRLIPSTETAPAAFEVSVVPENIALLSDGTPAHVRTISVTLRVEH